MQVNTALLLAASAALLGNAYVMVHKLHLDLPHAWTWQDWEYPLFYIIQGYLAYVILHGALGVRVPTW